MTVPIAALQWYRLQCYAWYRFSAIVTEGPVKTLRAFKRVQIPAGKTVNVELELTPKQLEWWDAQTNTMRTIAGNFDIMVGGNSKDAELQVKTLTLQ